MAELANRADYEREIALKLSSLNERHRLELRALLGTPPDIRNVPDEFWAQVRQDVAAELSLLLLLVYADSAEFHGLGSERAAQLGVAWADERATWVADRYVETSRDMLRRDSERWAETARENQPAPGEPSGPVVPEEEIDHDLGTIFGDERAERIGVSETTQAQSSGGEAGVKETVGLSENDIWYTEGDRRVCPVCMPFHKTPRSVWSATFPNGPGPEVHPGCRCWIVYERVTATLEVTQ